MIKISVERQTLAELAAAVAELATVLSASEGAKPHIMNDAPKPAKPRKEKLGNAADASGKVAESSSPASTPTAGAESPPPPGIALESGEFVPAENLKAPAVDSEAVRAELRALLSGLVRAGKQPQVNELVTSYAPALSQVPAEKLSELKQKAEAL